MTQTAQTYKNCQSFLNGLDIKTREIIRVAAVKAQNELSLKESIHATDKMSVTNEKKFKPF